MKTVTGNTEIMNISHVLHRVLLVLIILGAHGLSSACDANIEVDDIDLSTINNDDDRLSILQYHPKEKILPILANYKFWYIQSGDDHPDYVPLTLLWFSDIHGNAENLARISTFYDEYKEYIDDVLHSGDCLYLNFEDDFTYWRENGGGGFLNILGNHDSINKKNGDLNLVSTSVCFERFFKPYITNWGVTYQKDKLYWFKDYPFAFSQNTPGGIRLIALDLFHWKENLFIIGDNEKTMNSYPDGTPTDQGEQEKWFIETLNNARERGMAVIVTVHNPTPDLVDIVCSFNSIDRSGAFGLRSDMIQDVQNFIDEGGEFITWLCGHSHQDQMGTLVNFPKQTLITVGTSSYSIISRYDYMVKNTISMDRFNIFNIEPHNKFIRMFRVGLEYDRHGRHIGSLVYDYKNRVLISND